MAVTLDDLKSRGIDYLIASIEEGELVMEPYCACGTMLDENYRCPQCDRLCECKFVACSSPEAMAIVEKLIAGNPTFRHFDASLIAQ